MDKLQITGGVPLEGEVRISGAKNATLPILAAGLLASEPVTICNVPHLKDVTTTIELLGRMGVSVTIAEGLRIEVDASHSHGVLRALRSGEDHARVHPGAGPAGGPLRPRRRVPAGGCAIGARPVNIHVAGLHAHGRRHPDRGRLHPRAGHPSAGRAPGAGCGHGDGHREPHDGRDPRRRRDGAGKRRARARGGGSGAIS